MPTLGLFYLIMNNAHVENSLFEHIDGMKSPKVKGF